MKIGLQSLCIFAVFLWSCGGSKKTSYKGESHSKKSSEGDVQQNENKGSQTLDDGQNNEDQTGTMSAYKQHCAACHGPIEDTKLLDRLVADIKQAINEVPQMQSLSSLTEDTLKKIEMELKSEVEGPVDTEPETGGNDGNTTEIGGVDLYEKHCQACHAPIDESTKLGSTASMISAAITSVGAMKKLSVLTSNEINLIADALASDTSQNTQQPYQENVDISSFNFIKSKLQFLLNHYQTITGDFELFGGRCQASNRKCKRLSEYESLAGRASFQRSLKIQSLCSDRFQVENSFEHLAGKLELQKFSTVEGKMERLYRGMFDWQQPSSETLKALVQEFSSMQGSDAQKWKEVSYAMCSSSKFSVRSPRIEIEKDSLGKFAKCYHMITNQYLKPDHKLFSAVEDQGKDPVEACMEVLATAKLEPTGLTRENSIESKNILRNFQSIHRDHFYENGLSGGMIRHSLDLGSSASYFTYALLAGKNPSYIFTTSDYINVIRPYDSSGADGLKVDVGARTPIAWKNGDQTVLERVLDEKGGGFLGSPVYYQQYHSNGSILYSGNNNNYLVRNGGNLINRRIGQGYFNDALCRELPVVRKGDVENYIRSQSDVQFRPSATCTQCHASMDQVAYGYRNVANRSVSLDGGNSYMKWFDQVTPSKAIQEYWPAVNSLDFPKRDPWGKVFFRNYKGELVSESFIGINGLGQVTQGLDDTYICLAKKYFKYFTGYDVDIGDPHGKSFSKEEQSHRDEVIKLGLELKTNGSLESLIESILRSKSF